jgi:hypothetical protein
MDIWSKNEKKRFCLKNKRDWKERDKGEKMDERIYKKKHKKKREKMGEKIYENKRETVIYKIRNPQANRKK